MTELLHKQDCIDFKENLDLPIKGSPANRLKQFFISSFVIPGAEDLSKIR